MILSGITACTEAPDPEIRSVNDEEAAAAADSIRSEISATLADDLELSLWAHETLLADPIALHMDNHGRALITVTNRSRNSEFDIRDVDSSWLFETIIMESVEDRRDFLHRELAPERSEENTWLPDRNEDGFHDWRDLTVKKEEVYRLEDLTGNGMANQSQLFIRDFHEEITDVAGAVLYYNDEVFLGVGPDMWRIRDTNGDGSGDWKESISHGYNVHIGFSGHGMSGLAVGPDGRVYWSIGDMGLNVVDREGKRWYYPNQGAILRSEPDGSNFEVFASGVRNTHEFTFDKYGNLITVDNDGDHAGEYERLVYLVNGSDSGWRINWQFGKYTDPRNNDYKVWMDEEYFTPHFEDQAAHVLPPISRYHAGPAGMVYNPGTALNDSWKDHFFVMSFRGSVANSPLNAFTLRESGASFELDTDQEVARGVLAVGLDFGPDGALYMADWIEGWGRNEKGRIWRLDSADEAGSSLRAETQELLSGGFNERPADELVTLMKHEDMRVRQEAQFELAGRKDAQSLFSAIEDSRHQLGRIHGIWGLAQLGRQNIDSVEPLLGFLNDPDPEIRAQTAKMLGDVRYEPAAEAVFALLADDHPRVRFFAAEATGRIGNREGFQPLVNMLEENDDEDIYLRQAGAIALSRLNDAESVTALSGHSSRAVRIAAVVALKRMEDPGAAEFLQDRDEYVVTNAARAIADDAFVEEAIPELARMLDQEQYTGEPLIRRAVNASLYSGTTEDAERLARFSLRTDVTDALRVEALQTLAVWAAPSVFDRVTGRHRGRIKNDPESAREALGPVVHQLFSEESSAVRIAAVEAVAELGHEPAVAGLEALLQQDTHGQVRIAALRSLAALSYENMEHAARLALEDDQQSVRRAALELIPGLDLDEESKAGLLTSALAEGAYEEQQTAFGLLAGLRSQPAYDVLGSYLDLLLAGELAPEIRLDLIEAVENVDEENLTKRLNQYYSSGNRSEAADHYMESLSGGDADEGRRIFYQDAAAQCIRCHAVDDRGGDAGPDLTSVGSYLSREQILQSLVDPSARITPDYGIISLTLRNGETIHGVLRSETDSQITLSSGEQSWDIDKSDIAERTNAPSAMPEMGEILTRHQLRDLVEFLTTLQNDGG